MNLDDPQLRVEVEAIKQWFDSAAERAREERDSSLRELAKKYDLRQIDLITLTGYSRETVRQALNPTKRDEIKARRRSEGREDFAYEAARTHIDPLAIDEILKDRAARDAVAVLASIDPQNEKALERIADSIAAGLPSGIVKVGALRRAVKAASEALGD